MATDKQLDDFVRRLDNIIKKGEEVVATDTEAYILFEPNTVDGARFFEWRNQALNFLTSLLGAGHVYTQNFREKCNEAHTHHAHSGMGTLRAVKEDLEGGYLFEFRELIHSEQFTDFLEMADHLLTNGGYKDAAAVLAGGVLEAHLRNLCQKNNISVERLTGRGAKSKNVETLNADLAAAGVITKMEQKSVTAWSDLRNKAAHGNYEEYDHKHVKLLIQGIGDFVVRNPA